MMLSMRFPIEGCCAQFVFLLFCHLYWKRTRISISQKLDIEASKRFLKSQQIPPVVALSFEDQVNNNVSGEWSIGAAGMAPHKNFQFENHSNVNKGLDKKCEPKFQMRTIQFS